MKKKSKLIKVLLSIFSILVVGTVILFFVNKDLTKDSNDNIDSDKQGVEDSGEGKGGSKKKPTSKDEDADEKKKKEAELPDLSDFNVDGQEWLDEDPNELELENEDTSKPVKITPGYYERLTENNEELEKKFYIQADGKIKGYHETPNKDGYFLERIGDNGGVEKYLVFLTNKQQLDYEIGEYISFKGFYKAVYEETGYIAVENAEFEKMEDPFIEELERELNKAKSYDNEEESSESEDNQTEED